MLFRAILFALLISTFTSRANHAIYLSVVEISEGRVSIKVFSDDLQDVIRNYSEQTIHSDLDEFVSTNEEQINAYFNDKLKLRINGKLAAFDLIDSMKENDAHFLNFTFESDSIWKKLEVEGSYFTELFPGQINVLTISKGDKKHYAKLTKSEPAFKVLFE